jgi:hypothetical protein
MSDIMASTMGKIWFGTMMLGLKKKMDASKKGTEEKGEKKGGFSIDLKNIDNFTQMLGGFTVLRLTSMVGMVGVSFTKEELLKYNKQLNMIKKPRKK